MMLLENLREELLSRADGDDALILYGSYSRGDFDESSDLDILRISNDRAFCQQVGAHCSLHTYCRFDLIEMACFGSLFVLHLLEEARPLRDPMGDLEVLRAVFVRPKSFLRQAQQTLSRAIRIMDLDESAFSEAPDALFAVAQYLCRTLLYAAHADRGPFPFSLRELALVDATAALLLATKHNVPSYLRYKELRRAIRRAYTSEGNCEQIGTLEQLEEECAQDSIAASLLRRIRKGALGTMYTMPRNSGLQTSANESFA